MRRGPRRMDSHVMPERALEQHAHSWALAKARGSPRSLRERPPLPTPWLGSATLQTARGEVSVVLSPQLVVIRLSSRGAWAGSSVWAASTEVPPLGSVTADTALPGEGRPASESARRGEVSRELSEHLEDPALQETPSSTCSPSAGRSHALAPSLHLCGGVVGESVHTHGYPEA